MAQSKTSRSSRSRSSRRSRRRNQNTALIAGVIGGAAFLLVAVVLITMATSPTDTTVSTEFDDLPQSVDTSFGDAPGFALGEPNAPVTVVKYTDFSCGACGNLHAALKSVISTYAPRGDVKFVFKVLSFINPPTSIPAATAAICAGQQGLFYQGQDAIWARSQVAGTAGYTPNGLRSAISNVEGLDVDEYDSCFASAETEALVNALVEEALSMDVRSTPTIFVNGQQVRGDVNSIITAIEAELP
ncbi:MAG: thioredoxin domain-containing protein [Chloroflexi bacterium]|nr:thioredoxin domain-containing protein [Chloroflexota bacterium]